MHARRPDRTDYQPIGSAETTPACRALGMVTSTVDRFSGAVNTMALPFAIALPLRAWPRFDVPVSRATALVGVPLCAASLALEIAGSCGSHAHRSRAVRGAKIVDHRFTQIQEGANTFNFFLGAYIAVYVAAYAAANDIGSQEVDIDDAAYLLGFVAPAAAIGVAHVMLEFFKSAWEQRDTLKAKLLDAGHIGVNTLYNAGTLNEVVLFGLSWVGVSESGDMNPYVRLGLFGAAFASGLVLQILSHRCDKTAKPIRRLVEGVSTTNYLREIFSEETAGEYQANERALLLAAFIGLAVVAASSTVAQQFVRPVEQGQLSIQQSRSASVSSIADVERGATSSVVSSDDGSFSDDDRPQTAPIPAPMSQSYYVGSAYYLRGGVISAPEVDMMRPAAAVSVTGNPATRFTRARTRSQAPIGTDRRELDDSYSRDRANSF